MGGTLKLKRIAEGTRHMKLLFRVEKEPGYEEQRPRLKGWT